MSEQRRLCRDCSYFKVAQRFAGTDPLGTCTAKAPEEVLEAALRAAPRSMFYGRTRMNPMTDVSDCAHYKAREEGR